MAIEIGELRARLVAEATQIKSEIQSVKKNIMDMGKEAESSASHGFDRLNKSLSQIGLNADQIKKIDQQIKATNPQILEKQLDDVRKKLQELGVESDQIEKITKELRDSAQAADKTSDQLNETQKELKQIGSESKQVNKVTQELREAQTEAGHAQQAFGGIEQALTAIGASTALYQLVNVVKSTVSEASNLNRSLTGMNEIAKSFNYDIDETTNLAEELANRGFMTMAESAEAVKTSLASGLNLQETENLINALGDAAAFNREKHLDWGEAVVEAIRGIKSGNSELTDAAGITTNLSVMYDRYAKSIGTTADKLTDAQKVQAAYNGMLDEAALFAGNAEKALDGYAGTTARYTKAVAGARAELGESFIPVLDEIMKLITPLIVDFTKWADKNKDIVAGTAAATVTITGLTAAMTTAIAVAGALRIAMTALQLSIGPVGWALAGISALAAGVVSYGMAADAATGSVFKFAQSQDELNRRLDESPLKRNANDIRVMQEDIEKINELLERRKEIEEQLAQSRASQEDVLGGIAGLQRPDPEIAAELAKINNELSSLGIDTPEKANQVIADLKKQIDQATPALLEMKQAELADIAAKVDHIDQVEKLRDRYEQLNKIEKLNEEQKVELTSVVNGLKNEYPSLFAMMDEEGRLHIQNVDLVDSRIEAERAFVDETAKGMRTYLENLKQTTTVQAEELKTQISNIMKLAEAYNESNKMFPSDKGFVIDNWAVGAQASLPRLTNEYNRKILDVTKIEKALASISSGKWSDFTNSRSKGTGSGTTDGKKGSASDPVGDAYRTELQIAQQKYELNKAMYNDDIKQLEAHIERLKQIQTKYSKWINQHEQEKLQMKTTIVQKERELDHRRLEFSAEWIASEERRMKEAGATEEEIVLMKLDAWERVRSRYEEDTEEYKRADLELYNARMKLMEIEKQKAEELARERKKQLDELRRTIKDSIQDLESQEIDALDRKKDRINDEYQDELESIRDRESAESDSLDRRKQELSDFYADKNRQLEDSERRELDSLDRLRKEIESRYDLEIGKIDEEEQARERQELVDEIEKYKYATSKAGQEKLKELQERLRKMDVESEKKDLLAKKKQELESLDDRQDAIKDHYRDAKRELDRNKEEELRVIEERKRANKEYYDDLERELRKNKESQLRTLSEQRNAMKSYYNDLQKAFSTYSGDVKGIEKLLQDERLKMFSNTNSQIINEMRRFVDEYDSIINRTTPPSSGSSRSGSSPTSGGSSGGGSGGSSKSPTVTLKNGQDFKLVNDTAVIPSKKIASLLGLGDVKWNDETKEVLIGGKKFKQLYNENGTSYISVKQVADAFNRGYQWNSGNKTIDIYHTGGIAGGNKFSFKDRLLPDEIQTILQKSEIVFQPAQLASLLETVKSPTGEPLTINLYSQGMFDGANIALQDDLDVMSLAREISNAQGHMLDQKLRSAGRKR